MSKTQLWAARRRRSCWRTPPPAAGCWQQRTFDFAAINASCSSRVGMIYIVNRVSPSDRSFIGAIITASDDMIMAGQLPADGAGT